MGPFPSGFFTSTHLKNFRMADQTERAFQKQAAIFANRKGGLKKADARFTFNPGLGFKTPREAREGNYIDKKCPFTGKVSIRGRVLTGVITKMKMKNTSSSGGITCITSRNTIVLKNDTRMFLPICLHALGTSKSEMWLPLVNVDLSQKLSNSTP